MIVKSIIPTSIKASLKSNYRRARPYVWRVQRARKLPAAVRQKAEAGEAVRIQLGGARHRMEGWISTDITPAADYYLDATDMSRLPSGSVDLIHGEHFIEHLTLEDARRFASEAHRVL